MLLFEKLHRVSGAIAFADLRPVSHAAIVVETGDDCRIVDATLRETPVAETSLAEVLRLRTANARGTVPRVRSITALQVVAAGDPEVGAAIARQARRQVEGARFAVFDLAALAPYAYLRSAGRSMAPGLARALHGLVQAARGALTVVAPDLPGVTCSELVYRVLAGVEADGRPLAPEIAAPLVVGGRFRTDWGPTGEIPESADAGRGGLHHVAALAAEWVSAKRTTPPDGGDRARWLRRPPPELELADGVTPGDLLDSPSLEVTAMFLQLLR